MYVDKQEVDEDCLYLNIFTQFPVPKPPTPYPVVVYIHGGSWDHGSPRTFPGHMLAASQDLVVVTVAYRLGPLGESLNSSSRCPVLLPEGFDDLPINNWRCFPGFLATPGAPGNYGLLDLTAALRWVQQNIGAFNGDPGRVTVMGSEAGAAAAGLLALSPRSADLVHRVVALSGSAVAGWASMKDPDSMKNASHALGEALGCSPGSRLLNCLASRSVHDLRRTLVKPRFGWLPFSPVVDNQTRPKGEQFLPLAPQDLLDRLLPSSNFVFLSGVAANAAAELVEADPELRRFHEYQLDEAMFTRKVKQFMEQHNYTLNPQATLDTITFMYRPSWYEPRHLRQAYIDMLSDAYFKAPNDQMVKGLLRQGTRVYMYVLNYTQQGVPGPSWLGPTLSSEVLLASGAPFMATHLYSARSELVYATWTEADRNVSQLFMEAIGNLARVGKCRELCPRNPSPQQLFNTIRWERMERTNLQYLAINGTRWEVGQEPVSRMERDYRQREAELWQTYLPWVVARVPATWAPFLAPWAETRPLLAASIWSTGVLAVVFSVLAISACCLFLVRRRSDSY
ncbi:Gli [Cordylochernes scorpioides]|uniref:Gli n=1 Tax=Cordylochernes scorpioides TaxID=51811 RepID=A0ABY6LE64_9ARAC|nr:Gli [Cordylochernes scorpioides]